MEIRERFNEVTGRVELDVGAPHGQIRPADLVRACRELVARRGIERAYIRGVSAAVAELLVGEAGWHPGYVGRSYSLNAPGVRVAEDRAGVREASPRDAPVIARILNGAYVNFPDHRMPTAWVRECLSAPGRHGIVLAEEGNPVGFGCAVHAGGAGRLDWVCVLPSRQRRGYGTRITRLLVAELVRRGAKEVSLGLVSNTSWAARLYEREGFSFTGRLEYFPKYDR